jgi:DNA-binding NarL/FixJ family response regulator
MTTAKVSILIADDHPLFRRGLRQAIQEDPRVLSIEEAIDGEDALRKIAQLCPTMAILDISMPRKNGFEVARHVIEHGIPVDLIFLTMHDDEEMFNAAMDMGIKGYILKDSASADILQCINAVADGKYFVSPLITDYLIHRANRSGAFHQANPEVDQLSAMERRVLKLIAENLTSREIAERLHVSPKTVDTHRTNIAKKLDLHGTHSLVKFAIEHKSSL